MRVKDFGSGLNNDGLNIGMVYQHYGSILEKKIKIYFILVWCVLDYHKIQVCHKITGQSEIHVKTNNTNSM